ncbi:Hypothetical predicted protein, partial [Olea europaea subsp. europaea]
DEENVEDRDVALPEEKRSYRRAMLEMKKERTCPYPKRFLEYHPLNTSLERVF